MVLLFSLWRLHVRCRYLPSSACAVVNGALLWADAHFTLLTRRPANPHPVAMHRLTRWTMPRISRTRGRRWPLWVSRRSSRSSCSSCWPSSCTWATSRSPPTVRFVGSLCLRTLVLVTKDSGGRKLTWPQLLAGLCENYPDLLFRGSLPSRLSYCSPEAPVLVSMTAASGRFLLKPHYHITLPAQDEAVCSEDGKALQTVCRLLDVKKPAGTWATLSLLSVFSP